jgi:hypothetical protein
MDWTNHWYWQWTVFNTPEWQMDVGKQHGWHSGLEKAEVYLSEESKKTRLWKFRKAPVKNTYTHLN